MTRDQTPPASVVVLTDYEASRLVGFLGELFHSDHTTETRNLAKRLQAKVTAGRKLFDRS